MAGGEEDHHNRTLETAGIVEVKVTLPETVQPQRSLVSSREMGKPPLS